MKRFLFISVFVLGMIVIFFACEQDSGVCKQCKQVEIVDATQAKSVISPTKSYCGDDLSKVDEVIHLDGKTTKYECGAKK